MPKRRMSSLTSSSLTVWMCVSLTLGATTPALSADSEGTAKTDAAPRADSESAQAKAPDGKEADKKEADGTGSAKKETAKKDAASEEELLKQIAALIKDFYPRAKVELHGSSVHFEDKVRTEIGYYSRRAALTPESGGILGDVSVKEGKYTGKEKLPNEFNDGFRTVLTMAPYSKLKNAHLHAQLTYPPDITADFKDSFKNLVQTFNAGEVIAEEPPIRPPAPPPAQFTTSGATAQTSGSGSSTQTNAAGASSQTSAAGGNASGAPATQLASAQPGAAQQPSPAKANDAFDEQYSYEGKVLTPPQCQGLVLTQRAVKSIEKCDWSAADEQLRKAIELYPDFYLAHSSRAYVLGRMGKVDDAVQEADKAHQLAPNKIAPIGVLASIRQGTGQIDEAIKQYELMLKQFPKHPSAANTRALIEALKLESARQSAVMKNLNAGEKAADYFAFVTSRGVAKWTKDKFPLRIYIPTDAEVTKVPGYKPEYGAAMHEAFSQWEKRTNGLITFKMVPTAKDSDIEIRWTNNVAALSNPSECGEARTQFNLQTGIHHANIIMLTVIPGTPTIPVSEIKCTALHEIGHSLGLHGHSPSCSDILYFSVPLVDLLPVLTDRDVTTLTHLYKDDVKLVERICPPELPGNSLALNDEGVQLMGNKDYQKAAERFEAALKLNPRCEPAKRNLAATLKTLSSESEGKGKLADAATQMERAIKLGVEGDEEDKKNCADMLNSLAGLYTKMDKKADARVVTAVADNLMRGSSTSMKPILAALEPITDDVAGAPTTTTSAPASATPAPPAIASASPATAAATSSKTGSGTASSGTVNKPKPQQPEPEPDEVTEWSLLTPEVAPILLHKKFHLGVEEKVKADEKEAAAQKDIDFGPYMADLQRRIKRAWFPPKGEESRRVVVRFKIGTGGVLDRLQLFKTSGVAIADNAALKAVENAAPFRPLPVGAPDWVDIQFTFDYNVFSGGGQSVFKPYTTAPPKGASSAPAPTGGAVKQPQPDQNTWTNFMDAFSKFKKY